MGGAGAQADTAPAVTPSASVSGLETQIEGCLAARSRDDAAGARFPVVRSAAPEVSVTIEGQAAHVVHRLSHACCLESRTTLERSETTLTLTTTLSGIPCRCRCASVVHSRFPIPAGKPELVVRLEQDGAAHEAYRGALTAGPPAPDRPRRPKLPGSVHVEPKSAQ